MEFGNYQKNCFVCHQGGEFVIFKRNMSTNGSSWENQALWNFDFKAVPAISAFKP